MDLTDEKAKYLFGSCLIIGNLLRMSCQDLIDRFLDTFRVRNLLELFFGYDLLWRTSEFAIASKTVLAILPLIFP